MAKDRLDRGTSALEQRTFAELIASGAFDRHVRRMRTVYRRRRDDLEQAIAATARNCAWPASPPGCTP